MAEKMSNEHFWIIMVNDESERWAWRAEATSRGGLDVQAFRTRKDAEPARFRCQEIYGKAKLVKFIPESS